MAEEILKIENLVVTVRENAQRKVILNGLNASLRRGKITALVGGSGSGKTTTGLCILRLLSSALTIEDGIILFEGKDVLKSSEREMRAVRGKEIGMVFQEPLSAFNPVFRIGEQIEEVVVQHTDLDRDARCKRVLELLAMVGIAEPDRVCRSYPHQLSGGMRQRAMIAQAVAAGPKLIIADEPTSNLDVTIQARILELFRKLCDELKLSIVLITHDLGVVEHLADDVVVLFQGKAVEAGPVRQILQNPRHEFTKQLMEAFR